MLRSRVRAARAHGHGHSHGHAHDHSHGHDHGHGHAAHDDPLPRRGLIALGVSGGIIPCPSALVVLLARDLPAQIALGLLLIVAFSLGLAATLTGLGLLVVRATSVLQRSGLAGSRVAAVLPAVSSLAIVVVGAVLTLNAAQAVIA